MTQLKPTNQEAIAELRRMAATIEWDYPLEGQLAIDAAIEALETDIVRCEDCAHGELLYENKYVVTCGVFDRGMWGTGYCSFGMSKTEVEK